VPSGNFVLAGRDAASTKVVVLYAGDDPGAGHVTELDLTVSNLPLGAGTFEARRYEVSEATWSAGQGVKLVQTETSLSGGSYASSVRFGPGPGAGRVIVWELAAP